ncbi:MAG: YggT family protein [Nitrospinae bacterium]|nr:YggT family protein [Nitrospinota bacterium]
MFVLGNLINAAAMVLDMVLHIAMWLIIIRALISWVSPDPYNPIVQFLIRATDPMLRPIQRLVPPVSGLDLSPLIAIFAIYFLQAFLVASLHDMAARLG